MKRLIYLISLILTSCVSEVIEPVPPPDVIRNVFDIKESQVTNGQTIYFNLPSNGVYFLTLIDIKTNQVVSRERVIGVKGVSELNIYTKSIESRYLYLVLTDGNRVELNRTKLIFM